MDESFGDIYLQKYLSKQERKRQIKLTASRQGSDTYLLTFYATVIS